jgi:hypothetical protein
MGSTEVLRSLRYRAVGGRQKRKILLRYRGRRPQSDEFVKAWDAWDQSDPAKMPPLPQEPCLLISWNHAYICSQEEDRCANRE